MNNHWSSEAIFYHIYPLGFCAAPEKNDFSSAPVPRLSEISQWLDHIQSLGVNAIYLGPVFESTAHTYDTADYYWVDRRLGTNETLAALSRDMKARGMRLVLDGVFNHVGRNFWAFRDIQEKGQSSRYLDWFENLRFDQRSPYGDPFTYNGWNGHYSLVKLNLKNPEVRDHLFGAIHSWVQEYDIDGLRLDAADCLDFNFMSELAAFCRGLKPDFWLLGEVILGDYRNWANPSRFDSVTNYECYKGLYSSHVDSNFFELAYSLNRQFGPAGIYQDLLLYSFADNHDVNRIASTLKDMDHLRTVYTLLYTMPGIPSIYYGSEWGIAGKKIDHSDAPLRPHLDLNLLSHHAPRPDLPGLLARLASIRRDTPALRYGNYRQVLVNHQQFVFSREFSGEMVIIAVNSAPQAAAVEFNLPISHGLLTDLLNPEENFSIQNGKCQLAIPPKWGRILKVERS
ncbi:MAG: alpha-amylase [Anaerolineaceae bacterium]|nr:alpha-amylase [Anaerolineaceae bacterium]